MNKIIKNRPKTKKTIINTKQVKLIKELQKEIEDLKNNQNNIQTNNQNKQNYINQNNINNPNKTVKFSVDDEKLKNDFIIKNNVDNNQKKVIEIINLSKRYGKTEVLKNINLTLYEKQDIALLGANGAGKTTLIETILELQDYQTGEIKYHFDYQNKPTEQIGIQFQKSNYPYSLKVKDIIRFFIDVYDIQINKQQLKELIETFGLVEFYNKRIKTMSGGQQQRLNILLALIHKPKLLILDELTTGLDLSVQHKIVSFIDGYCKTHNINIILISHNIKEIENLAERIVILQQGILKVDILKEDAIKEYGSVENLLNMYI